MIVRESINFDRKDNPLDSLSVGRIQEREFAKLKLDAMDLLQSYDRLQPKVKREKAHIVEESATHFEVGFTYYSRHWRTFLYFYIEASLAPWNINGVAQKGLSLILYVGYKILEEGLNASQKKWTKGKIEECKPYLDTWIKEANEKHWDEGKVWESKMNFTRGGDVKASIGIGREKLIGDFIEEYNKKSVMNTFSKKLSMEDKTWVMEAAIKAGRADIVKLLVTDPTVDPSARRNKFLEIATKEGTAEIVQALLSDSRVNPADHRNLFLANAVEKNNLEIVQVLMADSRVDPAGAKMSLDKDYKEVPDPNYIIRIAAAENNLAIVKELLKDSRVDPTDALSVAVSKISKTGSKTGLSKWIPLIEFLLNHPRTEIPEKKRKTIEAKIEEVNKE